MYGQGCGRGGGGRGWGRGRHAAWFLEPFLLLLLREGEAHGYTLLEQLQQYGLEARNPSAVYRVLRDMEDQGWVTSTWEQEQTQGPPRRVYQLTAEGLEMLAYHANVLIETRKLIDRYLETYQTSSNEEKRK